MMAILLQHPSFHNAQALVRIIALGNVALPRNSDLQNTMRGGREGG